MCGDGVPFGGGGPNAWVDASGDSLDMAEATLLWHDWTVQPNTSVDQGSGGDVPTPKVQSPRGSGYATIDEAAIADLNAAIKLSDDWGREYSGIGFYNSSDGKFYSSSLLAGAPGSSNFKMSEE